MIDIKDLRKNFGKRTALHDLSLQVEAGQIYGLLGHNGAGKSTTIGLLLGHLVPDHGQVWIQGIHVQEERNKAIRRVGAIFEAPAFYNYLSGYRNLVIFSQYSGPTEEKRIAEIVELVGLTERIHEPVRRYSHGMRQRLALAQALLPGPVLLVLDEPTDGLDPEGIHEMRELVRRLNRELGLTILLSSHLLGEVEQLCHQVGILYQGHLLFNGDWREAAKQGPCVLRTPSLAAALELLGEQSWVDSSEVVFSAPEGSDSELAIRLGNNVPPSQIADLLVGKGIPVSTLKPSTDSLENFYLSVLQKHRREMQK